MSCGTRSTLTTTLVRHLPRNPRRWWTSTIFRNDLFGVSVGLETTAPGQSVRSPRTLHHLSRARRSTLPRLHLAPSRASGQATAPIRRSPTRTMLSSPHHLCCPRMPMASPGWPDRPPVIRGNSRDQGRSAVEFLALDQSTCRQLGVAGGGEGATPSLSRRQGEVVSTSSPTAFVFIPTRLPLLSLPVSAASPFLYTPVLMWICSIDCTSRTLLLSISLSRHHVPRLADCPAPPPPSYAPSPLTLIPIFMPVFACPRSHDTQACLPFRGCSLPMYIR